MNSDAKPKAVGFAKVPHGIVDAAIPETLKLLLWYCYDKPADWTFSVPEVARSLGKTPQCIRKYFRQFIDAGVLTRAGELPHKHGVIPLYSFHPDKVAALIKTQLKVNPETDPETDRETDPETDGETNPETDPATGVSHTKKDIPRTSTEKEYTEKEITKGNGTNGIDGSPSLKSSSGKGNENLDDEFESFFHQDEDAKPVVTSTSSDSPSVESQPAEGGVPVGMPSTSVAPSASSTIIQGACGKSNDGGTDKTENGPVSASAPTIQCPAGGKTNTGAPDNNAGHSATSANRAAGTSAKSGGVRGALPNAVVEHADWVMRQLRKSTPLTKESIEVVERELWKELSAYKWSQYPAWSDPRQEVRLLKDKLVRQHGQYK